MSLFGNLLLTIASIVFFLFITDILSKPAPKGGDAVVSYVWGILISNLIIFACLAIVAVLIYIKGGFDWVASGSGARILILVVGCICVFSTAAFSSFYNGEGGPLEFLMRVYSKFAVLILPLGMIVCFGILLNEGLRSHIPEGLYKWPLQFIFFVGVSGAASMLILLARDSAENAARVRERITEDDQRIHQQHLDEIDRCDVQANMVFLLVYTDANHPADVRERALAKMKTRPDWENEMFRLLRSDWAPEAFTFFASNKVEQPELFREAIHEGILNQARLIRMRIRESSHPSHFYPDLFNWEVERVLRTVDAFEATGNSYKADVIELRKALDEPSEFEKPRFTCQRRLDDWIKSH